MKKLFTILGAALMFGSLASKAENVEVWVMYYDSDAKDYVYEQSFESELVRNSDGSYTFENFFNSGSPASFTFEQPELYEYVPLKMTGDLFYYPGYDFPYLMNTSDFEVGEDGWPVDTDVYLTCHSYSFDDEETTLWYPYVDDIEDPVYSSSVSAMDKEEDGADYYGMIVLAATLSDGSNSPWYYLNFIFDEQEIPAPAEEEEGQPITVWTSYWDDELGEAMELRDYETTLLKNEDGSYTIKDFFNSGCPASFTLAPGQSFIKALHMCGNIWNDPERPGYPFIMTSSDFTIGSEGYPVNLYDYLTCYAYSNDGDVTPINMTFVDETSDYTSYAMALDPDYTVFITVSGADEDGNELPEFYLQFEFDDSLFASTGVKNIEADTNAPIEYYNINGMRVSDPSNGIFIRKQGSEVKKVIIRK